jgi:hypothetical protein
MKRIGSIIFSMFLSASVAAVDLPTMTFEPSQAGWDRQSLSASYGQFEQIDVNGILIPSKTFFIELEESESADMISFLELAADTLDVIDPRVEQSDIATSDNRSRYAAVRSASDLDQVSALPITVTSATLNDRSGALISIRPVTVRETGVVTLSAEIALYVGSRLATPEELTVDPVIAVPALDAKSYDQGASLSGSSVDYLIVTSPKLASELERLAVYKNQCGYRTEIELIGDIVTAYSGRDDAEALRERLKRFHEEGGSYVLLAGDETILPIRHAYHSITDVEPEQYDLQVCDLYFADLEDDWDDDNDGIFGERHTDAARLTPEVLVGRLPFNTAEQVAVYIDKLIAYETVATNDPAYLSRAFFFSSDQMRDYGGDGQHARIAEAYPGWFEVDSSSGVEASSGYDLAPTNLSGSESIQRLSEGFGIINIIAHGRNDGFVVRSSGYNDAPKSYILSDATGSDGALIGMSRVNQPALYYSLSCDIGGFDLDQPPISHPYQNFAENALSSPGAGAVAFVAYSRWGWVGSSHYLQKAYFDSLFAHPELPASAAMYSSKLNFPYYRDLIYGQNFLGDPSLRIFTDIPVRLSIAVSSMDAGWSATVRANSQPVSPTTLVLSMDGIIVDRILTDANGSASLGSALSLGTEYVLTVNKPGSPITQHSFVPGLVTAVEDETETLPTRFELAQNYPNPFNPTTTISFNLANRSHAALTVHNILGETVVKLLDADLASGRHEQVWDSRNAAGKEVASGVYFYRLEADDFVAVRKMVLLR